MKVATIRELLGRTVAAKKPDRALDHALYDAFCSHATQEFTEWDARHDFTHSLDTALALVAKMAPGQEADFLRLAVSIEGKRSDRHVRRSALDVSQLARDVVAVLLRHIIAGEP